MQPDRGESPCTPNTLIRNYRNGLASRQGGPTRFFLRVSGNAVSMYLWNPMALGAF